jgi:hypothetical protein
MAVCPVCEHAQERGDTCEVCGKHLQGAGVVADPTPRLEGLEPTRLDAATEVDAGPIPDLEPTVLAPVPALGIEDAAGWMERTAMDPVAAVAVEAIEVDRTPEADRLPPTDWFAAPICRYCRAQSALGDVFCAGCGMKLAIYHPSAPEPARRAARRCSRCGELGSDERCPGCGARLAPEEP